MNYINLEAENFKEEVVRLINESDLPACIVYYVFKEVFSDVESSYRETVIKEYNLNKKEEKETNDN